MADELARVCIRVWADDYEYLRRMRGNLGLNLLIRQIIHSYVVHVKDQEKEHLGRVPDTELDPINLDGLDMTPEPPPVTKGEVVDIEL